ncbi:Tn3 family transposase [Peribacillus frigoritolerans]|nr:Tn3 family transposase [Peribacillus frigoritolerans]WHY16758.1 Tn3 family transposase [Peribacillus frigoritolerans]
MLPTLSHFSECKKAQLANAGKGTTIYRFTSDQFSSFYTKVIKINARDAVHVNPFKLRL